MRSSFLVPFFVLSLSLWPIINCNQDQLESLLKLQDLMGNYKSKIQDTIKMVKSTVSSGRKGLPTPQLKDIKDSLTKITSFVQNDKALHSIEGFSQLLGPLNQLKDVAKKLVSNGLASLKELTSVFGKLSTVTSSLQMAVAQGTEGLGGDDAADTVQGGSSQIQQGVFSS